MRYRVRKEGGVGSSIAGMFFGMLMIVFGSPIAAWYAESQNSAEDFSSAVVVASTSVEEGYIVVEDAAVPQDDLLCPYPGLHGLVEEAAVPTDAAAPTPMSDNADAQTCIYVETVKERYERAEKEQCGSLQENQTVIRQLEDLCDADGTNCESCYLVEEYDWSIVEEESNEEFGAFTLGDFNIDPEDTPNFIGSEELTEYEDTIAKTSPVEGDVRWLYTYFPAEQPVLVAGNAESNQIRGAYDGKPFVISNLSYGGTLEALQSQDNTAKWGLRILSLALMVFGMVLVTGPLTLFTNIFRVIPVVGKHMDKGFDGVVGFIAAVIGVALWVVLYGIVLLLKNIVAIILVLAVVGAAVFWLVRRGKQRRSEAPPVEPPQNPSPPTPGV